MTLPVCFPASQSDRSLFWFPVSCYVRVCARCVSLLSEMPKSSSVVLCALKLPTSRAAGVEIDFADPNRFCHLPVPPPCGHGALWHQGHWANGSQSDTGNIERISRQIPSGGSHDTFTWTQLHELNVVVFNYFFHHIVSFSSPISARFLCCLTKTLGCSRLHSVT